MSGSSTLWSRKKRSSGCSDPVPDRLCAPGRLERLRADRSPCFDTRCSGLLFLRHSSILKNYTMIDLHTHSLFSDGELIPAELVRRAVTRGYTAIAITDHADHSNLEFIVLNVLKTVKAIAPYVPIAVIPGVEITHVPPPLIADLVREARSIGATFVVIHGETIVEPVQEGTNRAGIEAGADLIAHPGLITDEDLRLAKETGITLEITARKGHCLSNGHVAKKAAALGIPLTVNTDAHSPSDLISHDFAVEVLRSAGLDEDDVSRALSNAQRLVETALRR